MDKLRLTEMACWPYNTVIITRLNDNTFYVELTHGYEGRYSFDNGTDLIIFLVNNLFTTKELKEIKEELGIEYGME